MADTLSSPIPQQHLMESAACANLFAFRLWVRALGAEIPPCGAGNSDSAQALIHAFAGHHDMPARLLAGLLLAADLRPDDRLWVEGSAPVWLPQALLLTAGRAMTPEDATVLVTDAWPKALSPRIKRVILTGERAGPGVASPGITVSHARDWT